MVDVDGERYLTVCGAQGRVSPGVCMKRGKEEEEERTHC